FAQQLAQKLRDPDTARSRIPQGSFLSDLRRNSSAGPFAWTVAVNLVFSSELYSSGNNSRAGESICPTPASGDGAEPSGNASLLMTPWCSPIAAPSFPRVVLREKRPSPPVKPVDPPPRVEPVGVKETTALASGLSFR